MPTTLSQRLARFVVGLNLADPPDPAIDKAKTCVLRFPAVGISGADGRPTSGHDPLAAIVAGYETCGGPAARAAGGHGAPRAGLGDPRRAPQAPPDVDV